MRILPSKHNPFSKAFTLIELILIVVILGILTAVTIPRLNSVHEMKLNSAVKKVAVDIEYAQSAALSRNTDTRIVFDASSDSYYAEIYNDGSWAFLADPVYRGDMNVDFQADNSQFKDVDIDSADFNSGSVLRFNWEGTPADGGGSALAAQGILNFSFRGNSLSLLVSPGTGKITVQ